MQRKTYTTARLVLRPYRSSDYSTWFNACTKGLPAQSRFDPPPQPVALCLKSRFNKVMKKQQRLAKKDAMYNYGVFLKKSGVLVGNVNFFVIRRDVYQMANLGYHIFNRHQGRGYGPEAVKRAVRFAFQDLKLHRLEAAIMPDNRASVAVAKKVGLHPEGIKENYWQEGGEWHDCLVYTATPEMFGIPYQAPAKSNISAPASTARKRKSHQNIRSKTANI